MVRPGPFPLPTSPAAATCAARLPANPAIGAVSSRSYFAPWIAPAFRRCRITRITASRRPAARGHGATGRQRNRPAQPPCPAAAQPRSQVPLGSRAGGRAVAAGPARSPSSSGRCPWPGRPRSPLSAVPAGRPRCRTRGRESPGCAPASARRLGKRRCDRARARRGSGAAGGRLGAAPPRNPRPPAALT